MELTIVMTVAKHAEADQTDQGEKPAVATVTEIMTP
jgi:hypothetical protein